MDQETHLPAAELEAIREAEAELPAPTYWPAVLALGVTSLCFGLLTSGIFFYAGLIVTVVAIGAWMRLLLRDPAHGHETAGHEEAGR